MLAQSESVIGAPEPRHFPMPMARFGLNPFNEPLWRIVFAPSVFYLVGGKWPDGVIEYRMRPRYRELASSAPKDKETGVPYAWVLEKWISAFEDSGMTESTYNLMFTDTSTGLLLNGPYPSRGVYHHVHTFDAVSPGDCNLEWIVGIIAKAKSNDPAQVKQAIDEHYAAEQKRKRAEGIDQARNSGPAFGMRPASLPGGGVHSSKSTKFNLTAPELAAQRRVPRGAGKATVGRRPDLELTIEGSA